MNVIIARALRPYYIEYKWSICLLLVGSVVMCLYYLYFIILLLLLLFIISRLLKAISHLISFVIFSNSNYNFLLGVNEIMFFSSHCALLCIYILLIKMNCNRKTLLTYNENRVSFDLLINLPVVISRCPMSIAENIQNLILCE